MPPRKKIDAWFKEEKDATVQVEKSRTSCDWERLSIALEALCVAREERTRAAKNGKRVRLLESVEEAGDIQEGGRFLVRPPLVARDAAIVDHALRAKGISAIVICREPTTKLGLCPIVALGTGVTVRVQVEAPSNPERPTCGWFDHAMDELGEHVIDLIDTESPLQRQLDHLLAYISATPLHTNAFKTAIRLCNALARQSE